MLKPKAQIFNTYPLLFCAKSLVAVYIYIYSVHVSSKKIALNLFQKGGKRH
jgi:hypothetical protein